MEKGSRTEVQLSFHKTDYNVWFGLPEWNRDDIGIDTSTTTVEERIELNDFLSPFPEDLSRIQNILPWGPTKLKFQEELHVRQ